MEKLAVRVEEACELVGIGRTKGYELCATGQWPTIRIGRAVRVPVDGLKRWLAEQTDGNLHETRHDRQGIVSEPRGKESGLPGRSPNALVP